MKVKVKFLSLLGELFGTSETEIELESPANVQQLLNRLCDSDERRQKIFDESGELSPFTMVLKNGRHIHNLQGIKTMLEEGDEIVMFPPMGGG